MILAPATVAMAPYVQRWFADAEMAQSLPVEPLGLNVLEESEYLDRNFAEDYHLFVGMWQERPVGLCGLHGLSGVTARTVTIVDSKYRGRGFASTLRSRMVWYAFDVLGLSTIQGSVLGCNAAAARLMEKTGARHAGSVLRVVHGSVHIVHNFEQTAQTSMGEGWPQMLPACVCANMTRGDDVPALDD